MLDKPLTYKSQVSIVEADDKLPPAPTVLMSDQFIANYKLKVLFFLTLLQSLSYAVIAYILIKLQVLYLAFSADQMAETHDEEKVLLYIIFVATIFISFLLQCLAKLKITQAGQDIEGALRDRLLKSILSKDIQWLNKQGN